MIDWALFLPACFALNLAFGPNNLLAMTHGAKNGVLFAQKASIGRLLAFVPMIGVSALGLGFILTTSAMVFSVVKVIGAAYLVWLGIGLLRSARTVDVSDFTSAPVSLRKGFRTEALVALSNPKAILIFAAFFPQFVPLDFYWQAYAQLGAVFIAMEAIAILAYAAAGRFASGMAANRLPAMQRLSGVTMCIFGLLLLISPAPSRS